MLGAIIPSVNEVWNIVFLNLPDLCTMVVAARRPQDTVRLQLAVYRA